MNRIKAAAAALLLTLILGVGPHEKKTFMGQGVRTAGNGQTTRSAPGEAGKDQEGRIENETRQTGLDNLTRNPALRVPGGRLQKGLGFGKISFEGVTRKPEPLTGERAEGQESRLTTGRTAGYFPGGRDHTTSLINSHAFTITAYTAGFESTQKKSGQPGYGITYSGTKVKEGRTIAADLNVLPLGTRVLIEGVGERVVEDKGGAVKGNHIDMYIADLQDAKDWGRQQRQITVLEWGKG